MEDGAIIELYFERNERAITETEEKYGRLLTNIATRIVGDRHDAEECVNDAYLGVWNAIPPERPKSLTAFIAKIARNISISRLKYRLAAKRNYDLVLSLDELENVIPDTEAFYEMDDEKIGALISEFLYLEDEEARKLFIRKYWYFDSIAELSEKFGYSESKIKSVLFRTRNKLKEYLTEKGVAV